MDTRNRTLKEMSPLSSLLPSSIADSSRSELLNLIRVMESDLEERELCIANLKSEKAKQLFYQAKYGRFGLGDPFNALQRDTGESAPNRTEALGSSEDSARSNACFDNQRGQLETLIANQRRAQQRMREQMETMEKKYNKVCAELEEEKRKHEKDAAQGDDVLVMLEKERERLKSEVEYERANLHKTEKEYYRDAKALEEQRMCSAKQRRVAQQLVRERKALTEALVQQRQRAGLLEKLLTDTQAKSADLDKSLGAERDKTAGMEASLKLRIAEFESERDQLQTRLVREEARHKELAAELGALRATSSGKRATPPEPPVRRTPSAIPQPKPGSGPALPRVSVGTSPSQQRRNLPAHHHPAGGARAAPAAAAQKEKAVNSVKAVTVNGK